MPCLDDAEKKQEYDEALREEKEAGRQTGPEDPAPQQETTEKHDKPPEQDPTEEQAIPPEATSEEMEKQYSWEEPMEPARKSAKVPTGFWIGS